MLNSCTTGFSLGLMNLIGSKERFTIARGSLIQGEAISLVKNKVTVISFVKNHITVDDWIKIRVLCKSARTLKSAPKIKVQLA